jgi:hypothetical protein
MLRELLSRNGRATIKEIASEVPGRRKVSALQHMPPSEELFNVKTLRRKLTAASQDPIISR